MIYIFIVILIVCVLINLLADEINVKVVSLNLCIVMSANIQMWDINDRYHTIDKQKLIEHNLLQHNSKTGELEPVGKLKEIMEEINNGN